MKKKTFLIMIMVALTIVSACGTIENEDTTASSQMPDTTNVPNGGLKGDSVDTTSITHQYINIPYDEVSQTQTLNIYLPNDGNGPFPVIVAIHGGAFKMGSATGSDVSAMLEGVNHGYAVVSVNYRLSGEAIFPAAVNDCNAAIRFIKANAEQYSLDPDKIAIWGDSAGGNLAAMVGTSGESKIQAVVDWFGPLDFLSMDAQFEELGITPKFGKTSVNSSPESQYIGQLITLDPDLTQKANPMSYIEQMDRADAPSFLIQHGTMDANVPYLQSVEFSEQLINQIGEEKVVFELIEGAGHGTQEFTTTENLDKVFSFIDSVLK